MFFLQFLTGLAYITVAKTNHFDASNVLSTYRTSKHFVHSLKRRKGISSQCTEEILRTGSIAGLKEKGELSGSVRCAVRTKVAESKKLVTSFTAVTKYVGSRC